MARRPLKKKVREILCLRLDRKVSVREIAFACSIGHSTVDEYLHRAATTRLSWPMPDQMTEARLEQSFSPPLTARKNRLVSRKIC